MAKGRSALLPLGLSLSKAFALRGWSRANREAFILDK